MKDKLLNLKSLEKLIKTLKNKRKKIVFTNGCFDLIHPGHIEVLKQAKNKGDILIVGLNSDQSIKKIKGGNRPVLDLKSRISILSAIGYVDYIIPFSDLTPLNLIKRIKPNVLVKGGDWKKEDIAGYDIVKNNGGKVSRVKLKKGFSTTNIIKKIIKTQKNGRKE